MHAFDPPTMPVTNELFYNYDYGDDWLFRISCKEIYSRVSERTNENETKAALRKAGAQLKKMNSGSGPSSGTGSASNAGSASGALIRKQLEACNWGRDYMADYLFVDSAGNQVHADLRNALLQSSLNAEPVCIFAEGLPPVEDVGGPGGFFDFIRTIHGDNSEKAVSLREWARSQGWKGVLPKDPRSLL